MAPLEECIRQAYCSWLAPRLPERAIAVTVTFKPTRAGGSVSPDTARDAVRHFSNQMNQKAYGRKFKQRARRLDFIPVMEGGQGVGEKHLHCHIQLEVPDRWSMESWIRTAEYSLRKIRCVGSEQCKVLPVTDSGWQSYMLKARDKTSFADAIDVTNLWVN